MFADHPLRNEAERLCPGLKRSRGDGLYTYKAINCTPELTAVWSGSSTGELIPTEKGIHAMRAYLIKKCKPDPLYSVYASRPYTLEDILLLCKGIKLFENCTPAALTAYDRTIREACAEKLRIQSASGGTLDICRMIVMLLESESERANLPDPIKQNSLSRRNRSEDQDPICRA